MLVRIGTFSDAVFARFSGGATARVVGASTHVTIVSSSTVRVTSKPTVTVSGGCVSVSAVSGVTTRVVGRSAPVRDVVIVQLLEFWTEIKGYQESIYAMLRQQDSIS